MDHSTVISKYQKAFIAHENAHKNYEEKEQLWNQANAEAVKARDALKDAKTQLESALNDEARAFSFPENKAMSEPPKNKVISPNHQVRVK